MYLISIIIASGVLLWILWVKGTKMMTTAIFGTNIQNLANQKNFSKQIKRTVDYILWISV